MWEKLEPRERLLILIAAGLLVFMVLFLVGRKIYRMRKDLGERVMETSSDSQTLDKILQEYTYFTTLDTTGGERDPSEFYGKLDPLFVQYGLKERISTMKDHTKEIDKKYQAIIIDVNFRGVPLESVMKLIYEIDKNKRVNARVEYLQINKPYQDKNAYDVNMKLAAYSASTKARPN
ncbi:hypothetical protein [Leptospira perolatii]|uniref:Type II secretion system protein M n=1 Tax=Leptospira perolatii TaxID=2023191 RepID=A0ABX4P639_9LEPT|nr:hypothetical protein [Leptospira perolatii]PJZ68531.1 hypothetical protein CH360_15655 [Leptospira perolatii]